MRYDPLLPGPFAAACASASVGAKQSRYYTEKRHDRIAAQKIFDFGSSVLEFGEMQEPILYPLIIQQNVHSDKSNKKSSSSNSYKSSSLNNNENPISCLCWLTPDVIAVGYRNGVFRCYSGMTGELLLSKLFQKGKATLMSLKIFQCCISNETMDTREKGLWALYRDGSIVCIRMKDLLDGAYDVNNDVKYKRWKCQQRSKHIVPLDFVCSIPFRVDTFDLRPKVGININIAGEDPTVSQYFVTADKEKEIDIFAKVLFQTQARNNV